MSIEQNIEWYRDQVVFLTGGTGTLGGCLLHKLSVQLPTAKIFVLCRGSIGRAIEKWEESMPAQADEMLDTGKISFVLGDMTRPDLGLKPTDLQQLREQVTIVINAAGDISLEKQLQDTIHINCVSHLTLTALLAGFVHLRAFLHVSTAYVNSFLPEGVVEERIYTLGNDEPDPELRLSSILSTGCDPDTHRFTTPYALAKYLAERLILGRERSFPILIVRPSLLGPAIRDPHPGYGADGTIPVHSFIQTLVGSRDYGPFQLADTLPKQRIVDEIPVDLVANTCLVHLALGTTGIVHAAVELYVARTLGESVDRYRKYTPTEVVELVRQATSQGNQEVAQYFYELIQRTFGGWIHDCGRSRHLKDLAGPIGLSLEGHDPEAFLKRRVNQVSSDIRERLRTAEIVHSS
ncbi:putative secondary metabolism biosynthetic enzyme [Arachnomyces sp. PD_36]|nr:putative secondary metabolism biosynthetic enzyme [Arachnomyces sp. PD_36]